MSSSPAPLLASCPGTVTWDRQSRTFSSERSTLQYAGQKTIRILSTKTGVSVDFHFMADMRGPGEDNEIKITQFQSGLQANGRPLVLNVFNT